MYMDILVETLEQKIRECDERIAYYFQELENNPGDRMFEAALKRCQANKSAFEWELAKQQSNR